MTILRKIARLIAAYIFLLCVLYASAHVGYLTAPSPKPAPPPPHPDRTFTAEYEQWFPRSGSGWHWEWTGDALGQTTDKGIRLSNPTLKLVLDTRHVIDMEGLDLEIRPKSYSGPSFKVIWPTRRLNVTDMQRHLIATLAINRDHIFGMLNDDRTHIEEFFPDFLDLVMSYGDLKLNVGNISFKLHGRPNGSASAPRLKIYDIALALAGCEWRMVRDFEPAGPGCLVHRLKSLILDYEPAAGGPTVTGLIGERVQLAMLGKRRLSIARAEVTFVPSDSAVDIRLDAVTLTEDSGRVLFGPVKLSGRLTLANLAAVTALAGPVVPLDLTLLSVDRVTHWLAAAVDAHLGIRFDQLKVDFGEWVGALSGQATLDPNMVHGFTATISLKGDGWINLGLVALYVPEDAQAVLNQVGQRWAHIPGSSPDDPADSVATSTEIAVAGNGAVTFDGMRIDRGAPRPEP